MMWYLIWTEQEHHCQKKEQKGEKQSLSRQADKQERADLSCLGFSARELQVHGFKITIGESIRSIDL